MASTFYFKFSILEALAAEKPKEGETIDGVVFIEGHDDSGAPLLFPFFRIIDASGSVYLKESTDARTSGCPYPPPC